jgi:hypothetical protein
MSHGPFKYSVLLFANTVASDVVFPPMPALAITSRTRVDVEFNTPLQRLIFVHLLTTYYALWFRPITPLYDVLLFRRREVAIALMHVEGLRRSYLLDSG